jgi:hypothetical protein
MKTKVLLLIAICMAAFMAPHISHAQSSGGIGFFAPGLHTVRFGDLNASLPAGYPVIENQPFLTAGAGYGIISKFVIGGEGGTHHPGSFTSENLQVDLSSEYGFFSLGYVLLNRKGLLAFPLVSVGENDFAMYIHQSGQTATFPGVTSEPFQATTLRYNTKLLRFSLTGIYAIKGNVSGKGATGLMVGLTAGYQTAYKSGPWEYDNGPLTNGPDLSFNGFYVQLLLGGGGIMYR